MAHHVSLRLKLRKRSTQGQCEKEIIHPNCSFSQPQESKEDIPDSDTEHGYPDMDPGGDTGSCGV